MHRSDLQTWLQKAQHCQAVSCFLFLAESTRQRAYSLVAQAYTSIKADDFAAFVGYSVEEAVKGETSFHITESSSWSPLLKQFL